ncbi:hypothetical protein KBH77_04470 [Patescibacteria group bacterium]|nr:hypothetical protein [Patescibacteria group bacterium]
MNKKDKQNLIILLLILGVVIFFIIKKKKSQPTTRKSQSSSSSVKAGQGKGGGIAMEKTPQFAEWGKGKPGERRFSKDGYIYVWNDKFGWVKTDKYNEADLNKPPTTYWIHNNPDGTYVINNNPPDGQDGKGKGKGKGKGEGEGDFIDTYTNYLVAAADVITEIIPMVV